MRSGVQARPWEATAPFINSRKSQYQRPCGPINASLKHNTNNIPSSASSPLSLSTQPWYLTIQTRAVAALAAGVLATSTLLPNLPANAVTNEQLLYLEAWRAVDRAYVDKKFNGQNWFKYSALRRSTSGAVTGVGVEVSFASDRGASSPLVVIAPAPGGPAEKAGIRPGDEIMAIDGQQTSELSLYAAGGLLQGVEGSEVVLTLKARGATGTVKDVKLTRQPIKINPVDSAICTTSGNYAPNAAPTSKLGYIRIATFSKQTVEKFEAALASLKTEGVDRIVLDVRNNGGGLFSAGVEVGRMLINKGDIVLIADSNGVRDIYEADGHPLDDKTPLVVLVNRGTASASEVLSGALKDNGRAVLAGESTFGKGLIQTLVELSDGSAVAVTVAKYQTPAGIDINKIGISPKIVLDAEALTALPFNGAEFCKYAGTDAAPKLFG
ncbi:hypothetical protein Ndes2437B_g00861 [Nannochloris sp. 'desiccata']